MGDDNGNGICFGAGVLTGVLVTVIAYFLCVHLQWVW